MKPTHCVYTFVGDDDEVLYIGCTRNVMQRVQQHAYERGWWGDVARIELQHFPNLPEARFAERRLIEEKRPVHNVKHNRGPRMADLEVAA